MTAAVVAPKLGQLLFRRAAEALARVTRISRDVAVDELTAGAVVREEFAALTDEIDAAVSSGQLSRVERVQLLLAVSDELAELELELRGRP